MKILAISIHRCEPDDYFVLGWFAILKIETKRGVRELRGHHNRSWLRAIINAFKKRHLPEDFSLRN